MTDIAKLDADLNQMLLSGKMMEAFEKYYADDCSMQENNDAPTLGKDKNRDRELQFLGMVEQFHGMALKDRGVGESSTFGVWWMDVTYKGAPRMQQTQVAVRTWKDGKVVKEQFFYNKG